RACRQLGRLARRGFPRRPPHRAGALPQDPHQGRPGYFQGFEPRQPAPVALASLQMQDLAEVFGPQGPLKRSLPGFSPRRSQLAMAERVARALANRSPLVVEAGTGTGKTFAYLVP